MTQRWAAAASGEVPDEAPVTFNQYLLTRDGRNARPLARVLRRHRVVITTGWRGWVAFKEFLDAYPEYFRWLTREEMLAGVESVESLWRDYDHWMRAKNFPPVRNLDGSIYRPTLEI